MQFIPAAQRYDLTQDCTQPITPMPSFFAAISVYAPGLQPRKTSMSTPLQYPLQLQKFAKHPLTFGPSPIQPLKRLSEDLGGVPALNAHSFLFRNG